MAQFYATIKGNRGEASRLGTKESGITAKINGWNIGITVNIWHNADTGKDEISINKTGGSNGGKADEKIAQFTE